MGVQGMGGLANADISDKNALKWTTMAIVHFIVQGNEYEGFSEML